MSTVGAPSKTSVVTAIRQRFSGNATMDGQAGTLVRKLLDGRRLTQIEREIAAATGLGTAVAELVLATKSAQTPGANGFASAKNSANVVLKSRSVMAKAAEADRVFAENYKGYNAVSTKMKTGVAGQAYASSQPVREKVVQLAGDVVTVAGLGLSAIALPNMVKKTATSFQELSTLIHDPNATTDQRLDKAEEMVRASAGTVFSAQGVYLGVKGTTQILSRSKTIGSMFARLGDSRFLGFMKTSPVGKVLGALLPIADGAVFVGEVIATRRTFKDPNATGQQKLRKTLDMSLAGLKTAFWLFPGVKMLKSLYSFASFGQLSLMLYDFHKVLKPKLVSAAKTIAWGVTHPVEGARALADGTKKVAGSVASGVAKAFGWVADKVTHPGETWNTLKNEARAWYDAVVVGTGKTLSQWTHPVAPAAPAVTQTPAPAPAVAPAPIAAPVAPVVEPVAAPAPVAVAPELPAPIEVPAPVAAPEVDAAFAQAAAAIQAAPAPIEAAAAPSTDAAFEAAIAEINATA